jgi:hypothetical protein
MVAAVSLRSMKEWKGERLDDRLGRLVAGIECVFSLLVDDRLARPEDVFGDPRGFVTVPLLHRTGRSFHLPNGAAIYFDTGVIELASPVMELERGCFGRLARSLEVAVAFVRSQLDEWETHDHRRVRLQGFSTHYNVSVADQAATGRPSARMEDLSWLLAHVLPAPVMLLGTNCRSTGVGVRPRPRRIEVTADFPPDPARMAATGAVIAGIVSSISRWKNLDLESLRARRVPVIEGFRPSRHTSRRGWLARFDSYPANPFACPPDDQMWPTTLGRLSLRTMAWRSFSAFLRSIRRLSDPLSFRLASRILSGALPSWLDEDERPASYDDVGRGSPLPGALNSLGLARYERVILHAIEARPLLLEDELWTPIGVRGWSRVVFRRDRDGARTVLPLDTLVDRLDEWDHNARL